MASFGKQLFSCVLLVLLVGPSASASSGEAVIPPGQEDLLARLLGLRAELPGKCTFTNGEVQHTTVQVTYDCLGGAVVFRLVHPSKAPSGAIESTKFALIEESGTPPPGLATALVERLQKGESEFEWLWIGRDEEIATPRALVGLIAAAVLIAGALFWLLRRAARRRAS